MPLLLILIALFLPRLIIFLLWLFTGWFAGMFQGWLIPLLGFIFLPYTLLWYSAVQNWYGGRWDALQIVILIIAVMADLGSGIFSRR